MNKILLMSIFLASVFLTNKVYASATVPKPYVEMQIVDKITSHRFTVYTELNKYVQFKTIRINVKACYVNRPTETPEAEGYFIIMDAPKGHKEYKAFEGWLFASTPSIVAFKHSVYDVTIVNCVDQTP